MEYKGYTIVPFVGGVEYQFTAGFRIHKAQGNEWVNVHRFEPVAGMFSHDAIALREACKAARALIDADGPFTPEPH